jgi:hypothetical protein
MLAMVAGVDLDVRDALWSGVIVVVAAGGGGVFSLTAPPQAASSDKTKPAAAAARLLKASTATVAVVNQIENCDEIIFRIRNTSGRRRCTQLILAKKLMTFAR